MPRPTCRDSSSQDLGPLAVGASADSLLLEPDGELLGSAPVTRARRSAGSCSTSRGATARPWRRGCAGFLLWSKVELEPLDWRCLSLRGPRARDGVGPADRCRRARCSALPFEWNGSTASTCSVPATSCSVRQFPAGWSASAPTWRGGRIRGCVPALGTELTSTHPVETVSSRARWLHEGVFHGPGAVAQIEARGSNVPGAWCGSSQMAMVVDGPGHDAARRVPPTATAPPRRKVVER